MRIELITPALCSRKGNWVTATRWARMLRTLGHQVAVGRTYAGAKSDVLIALHAKKSFPSIERFRCEQPHRSLLVALTGTDLNRDRFRHLEPGKAMVWADRLIVLNPNARDGLALDLRAKTRVILQSATASRNPVNKTRRWFDVCVLGHLRPVKDPFRVAEAARLLPATSRIRVVHAGDALSNAMAHRAQREMTENPRYRWLGDRPAWQVRRLLGRSQVMVLSSTSEGGANVLSEAIVAGTAVLATRIPGSVGLLGDQHPGYFEVGDTKRLAELLVQCEANGAFLAGLARRSRDLAPRFHPKLEIAAWRDVLAELGAG